MKMQFTMEKEDIKEIRNMLSIGFDEIEKFIKNPDPRMTDQILDMIKEPKVFFDGFLSNVERINIYMEKNVTPSHKKSKKSKWGMLD